MNLSKLPNLSLATSSIVLPSLFACSLTLSNALSIQELLLFLSVSPFDEVESVAVLMPCSFKMFGFSSLFNHSCFCVSSRFSLSIVFCDFLFGKSSLELVETSAIKPKSIHDSLFFTGEGSLFVEEFAWSFPFSTHSSSLSLEELLELERSLRFFFFLDFFSFLCFFDFFSFFLLRDFLSLSSRDCSRFGSIHESSFLRLSSSLSPLFSASANTFSRAILICSLSDFFFQFDSKLEYFSRLILKKWFLIWSKKSEKLKIRLFLFSILIVKTGRY